MREQFNFWFLDRDGVINENAFVNTPSELEFLPNVFDAFQLLNQRAKGVFIATNQGGIEAGYLTEETLHEIHEDMTLAVNAQRGRIDKIYHCPHLKVDCECRKPKPGMLLQGISEHNLPKAECCFIGDWITDWQAAIAAGIQPVAVASGRKWTYEQVDFIKTHGIPNYFTLYDAVLALA